jgi:hypothetical protein
LNKIFYKAISHPKHSVITDVLIWDEKNVIGTYENPVRLCYIDLMRFIEKVDIIRKFNRKLNKYYVDLLNKKITKAEYEIMVDIIDEEVKMFDNMQK